MDLGLTDRAALVTGASKGLGRAVAERLAQEGADVAINSRSAGALKATAEEIARKSKRRVVPIAGDVSDEHFCQQLVRQATEELGRLDILIANAGGPPPGGVDAFGAQAYRDALALNLMSTVQLTLAALPQMRERRWGRVVAITSVAVKEPVKGLLLSNTARPGVVGFIKSISQELAPEGVLCNVAAPGFIHTDRVESLMESRAEAAGTSPEAVQKEIAAEIPMKRIGTPTEFANAVVFLASEAASYVTGHTLAIDGGLARGLL